MQIPQDSLKSLDPHLVYDWRTKLFSLWTIRIAVFWGAVSGLAAAWPAFAGTMPLWAFASASVVMCVALVVARLRKQPGVFE